jgi:hypothetical protein
MIFIILLLITAWLSTTLMIDFFIVPSIFRIIPDFFQAGELGAHVFSTYNRIELILISVIMSLVALSAKKNIYGRWLLLLGFLLFVITLTYNFYLTDRMKEIAAIWEYAEQTGQVGAPGLPDVQQTHQAYHRVYVVLDSIKIFLLIGCIGFLVRLKHASTPTHS